MGNLKFTPNPNFFPCPPKIELGFKDICIQSSKKQIDSIFGGSDYVSLSDDEIEHRILNDINKRKVIQIPTIINPENGKKEIIHFYNDYYDACWEENAEWLEKLVSYLTNNEDKEAENNLSWRMDILAENPIIALNSWSHRYQCSNSVTDLDEWRYFYYSSFYLMCLFAPDVFATFSNPLDMAKKISDIFDHTCLTYNTLRKTYTALANPSRRTSDYWEIVPTYELNYSWKRWTGKINDKLFYVFEKHIKRNGFTMKKELIKYIANEIEVCTKSDVSFTYYFPFVCTKIFAQIFFDRKGDLDSVPFENLIEFEKFGRLFNEHKRKRMDKTEEKTDDNPIIQFMLDVIHLTYEIESSLDRKNGVEFSGFVNRIDVNWLALYYFGKGRYFDYPLLLSNYSKLILPKVVDYLFWENDETITPDTTWLFPALNFPSYTALPKDDLLDVLYELESFPHESIEKNWNNPSWKDTFTRWLYEEDKWGSDCLLGNGENEFEKEIDDINQFIKLVEEKYQTDYENESAAFVRFYCACNLLFPALNLLCHFVRDFSLEENFYDKYLKVDMIELDKK